MSESIKINNKSLKQNRGYMRHEPAVIVGAGPAGLTAAYELIRCGITPIVIEKGDKVGGLARTETYKGYRFDIGGHRFYTKIKEVQELWEDMLKEDFIKVPRLSRIYYRGRFFNYPLSFLNALTNLGFFESVMIVLSYLKIKIFPLKKEETLEDWVTNRFGDRLYRTFFKTYTEKVWGIPCNQIQAEWAAQRIKGLSLVTAVWNALFGSNNVKSLINEFQYPIFGPGMMWQRFQEAVENRGGTVHLNTDVISFKRDEDEIKSVQVRIGDEVNEIAGKDFISSMPITELILHMDPPPPENVLKAAKSLSYRDFLIVSLVVDNNDLFPDNWIYIHNPDVKVGRIQNFKNWSRSMVPDPQKSCLGMEYFCNEGDSLWKLSDKELIELATNELACIGMAKKSEVSDGVVIRQYKAYPVYDSGYREHLQTIQDYLKTFKNLQTIGRNGMHHYNNQDHSMLTGLLAARNVLGENHDIWNVNTEQAYHEEYSTNSPASEKALSVAD
jgi:protoporphyrinogen oxidase